MRDARQRSDWGHTANVLCMLYNINRKAGTPARSPVDFNPCEHQEPVALSKEDARELFSSLAAAVKGEKK